MKKFGINKYTQKDWKNLVSVGAFIIASARKKKYLKEIEKF
jgi:hypothetical protein